MVCLASRNSAGFKLSSLLCPLKHCLQYTIPNRNSEHQVSIFSTLSASDFSKTWEGYRLIVSREQGRKIKADP